MPVRELAKGTQRRQLVKGDAEGQSTTDSRKDQSGKVESRGCEKDRQYESAFLVACRSFAKTARQRLSTDAQGMQCYRTPLLALFLPLPRLYSCGHKEMCDAPGGNH